MVRRKITASPNSETEAETTGVVNRLFAFSQRNRGRTRTFKSRHRKLFRTFKYGTVLLVFWLLVMAPWPFLR